MKLISILLLFTCFCSVPSLFRSGTSTPFNFHLLTPLPAPDTLYLDSKHKEVQKRKQAQFLKVVTKTDTGYVQELLTSTKQLQRKTTFKDADLKVQHGYSVYYAGKAIDNEGRYENDKHEGPWKYYFNGKVSAAVIYKDNKITSAEYFKPNGEKETDMSKVERLPSFPGGESAFGAYLTGTLKYPPEAREKRVQGRVVLEFTVTGTGQILDVDVITSVSHDIDREAVRVVRNMPLWNPGIQFGRPVKVRYKMPIFFRLG